MAEQWRHNEMGDEKMSFKAQERELVGGRFVQLFSIHGNSHTGASCGSIPLMSSATSNPL